MLQWVVCLLQHRVQVQGKRVLRLLCCFTGRGLLMTPCNGGLSWFQQKLYIYGLNVLAELCAPHIEDRYRPMYIG
jgi:hypothetical protein